MTHAMNIDHVYKNFPTQEACLKHLESVRWNSIPACPYCSVSNSSKRKSDHRYHCNNCNTSFSVTVGTIFHKTKVDLQKWFLAMSLVLNPKKVVSARQLARDLDVTKDTAWRMVMQIRKAFTEYGHMLERIIDYDEPHISDTNT